MAGVPWEDPQRSVEVAMSLKRMSSEAPLGFRSTRLPETTLAVARALGLALIAIGIWTMWQAMTHF